jgi:hypothetical protein
MKKTGIYAALLLVSLGLAGCVAEPYPYYGGVAPYYGTSVVPGYAYGEVVTGGAYYPYYRNSHVYSRYNVDYWNHQHRVAQAGRAAPARGAAPRGGQPHGGQPQGERR